MEFAMGVIGIAVAWITGVFGDLSAWLDKPATNNSILLGVIAMSYIFQWMVADVKDQLRSIPRPGPATSFSPDGY